MLGIAAKSGNVVSGEFSTEKAVKSYRAYLVIVSEEASENTRKKFRASIAITDENLAKAVVQKLSDYKTE